MSGDTTFQFFGGSLMKALASIFLFLVCVAAVGVYVYDAVNNLPINGVASAIMDFAISFALTTLGYNHGVTSAKEVVGSVIQSQKE